MGQPFWTNNWATQYLENIAWQACEAKRCIRKGDQYGAKMYARGAVTYARYMHRALGVILEK